MHDASRRRFLGQLALGGAAVGAGALPSLGRAQALEVDLSRLDGHPVTAAAPSTPPPAQGPAAMAAPPARPASPSAMDAPPAEPPADPAAGMGAAAPAAAPSEAPPVVERRALWVEPGYLVLLEWYRPAEGTAAVAALEGSAGAVGAFLQGRVTSSDDLHDFARLHAVEAELLGLLNGMVAPASIQVVHLDHDCQHVCSLLGGPTTPPDPYPMPGGMPAPGWE